MIIEFIGLPGSGKTHLTNLLCEDKRFIAPKERKITNAYRLKSILSICWSKVLLFHFVKVIFSFKDVMSKLKRFKALIYLKKYIYKPDGIIVYDQHLMQNLIAFQKVLGVEMNTKEIKSLLSFFEFPKHALIVYNNVNLERVVTRFKSRRESDNHNKTLLDDFNNRKLVQEMEQLLGITENTILCLKDLGIQILYCNLRAIVDIELLRAEILMLLNKQINE